MTIAQANERHVLHRRKPLFYVLLRDDGYACGAEVHVASGVIKVPMCIHQPRDGAQGRFEGRLAQLSSSRIHSAIDQQSAAGINNSRSVSSVPGKHE